MQTGTIRALDYWLGVPACAALTALTGFGARRYSPPKRIAFIKFIEQGATVLAREAIERAADRVGRENLYFCVFESNRAILDVLGIIPADNIICLRDRSILTFVPDFLGAIATLRRREVDTIIDMEFFSRASAIFAVLAGARIRVGLHRFTGELPYRGNLMTHRVQYNPHLHISLLYSLLVEASLSEPADDPLLKFPARDVATGRTGPGFTPTAEETARLRNRLGAGSPIVILNPNASDLLPLRKWDVGRFVELTHRLVQRYPNIRIAVTGGPTERAAAETLSNAVGSDRVVSFAGQTTLRELLTLYTLADVLVTNDSGPGHFASLTPVHAIVLFGPETPKLFGSLAPQTTLIWKELACSPCVNVFNHRESPCRNNVCMQMITVDDVDSAIEHALAQRVRQ